MRGWLLAGVSTLAIGAAIGLRSDRRQIGLNRSMARARRRRREDFDRDAVIRDFLLYFVLPVWMAAGVADCACHFASDLQTTTGPKESLIHLLMLAEVGLPIVAGLFLEITSPVLALMIASWLLHDATALWDVHYAVTAREVTPIEQHVHSYLEMLPLMAIGFVGVLYWPNLAGLLGIGGHRPDWSIRLKRDKLPRRYAPIVLGLTVLLEWLPYLTELGLGLKENHGRLKPPPARAAAR